MLSSYCFVLYVIASMVVGIHSQGSGNQVITVTNGETEGVWGPFERCPGGSRAVSFRTRNEFDLPIFDNSALNTIILFCDDALATNFTSTPGFSGSYQPIQTCPFGSYLNSFQLRVQPNGNTTDNTAANNIRFRCANGEEIESVGNTEGSWGDFSDACPTGICGMETRVKESGGVTVDNTALNDVRFTCCKQNANQSTSPSAADDM